MEEVGTRGAALDLPVRDENAPGIPPLPAPPGSTAMLLACAFLAMVGGKECRYPNLRRNGTARLFDSSGAGSCECAIRLVYLGADCQVKLQIPTQIETYQ
jgi:hypothetical protein